MLFTVIFTKKNDGMSEYNIILCPCLLVLTCPALLIYCKFLQKKVWSTLRLSGKRLSQSLAQINNTPHPYGDCAECTVRQTR